MVHYLIYKRKSSGLSNSFQTLICINVNSSYPYQITKQISTTVNTRITKLSSNNEFFDKNYKKTTKKKTYNEALKNVALNIFFLPGIFERY